MNVLLVSGGSGGHLNPALALAEYLRPADRCSILTTSRPVDRILAENAALAWTAVDLEGFTPMWRWLFPRYAARQLRGIRQAWSAVRRSRPDVVVGFGGYLSAVGLLAARSVGAAAVIHEQNILPGRANRILAPWADAVALSFPETGRHLPARARALLTGNPTRVCGRRTPGAEARAFFGFDTDRPVLLVLGGSQGSHWINRQVIRMWASCPGEERRRLQVIHIAGRPLEAAQVEEAYRPMGMTARVFPFLHSIEKALSAATLAVCRAGATGIAEMVEFSLPAILIPYPHARGHQKANARWMERAGGAVVLEEKDLSPERLWSGIQALLRDADRLDRMRRSLQACGNGSAASAGGGLTTALRPAAERLGELVRRLGRGR